MTDISQKVALVTGAGSGLGRALVLQLAEEGCRVIVADILFSNAEAVAREIDQKGGTAIALACDVSDRRDVQRLKSQANQTFGTVYLLFANAGATSFQRVNGISDDEVDWIIQVNLMGVINCVQAFLPDMVAARGGHLIATSSPAGLIPTLLSDHAPYAAAKAGIIGFMENLSMELNEVGVRTTTVFPSNVSTAMKYQNSSYRPERFGGPFDSEIIPPAGYVPHPQQSPEDAAAVVIRAVRENLRMIVTGDEFRQRFLDEYVASALQGFDAATEFKKDSVRR